MALRRAWVELDSDLLTRPQEVLATTTTRVTIEEALRRVVQAADAEFAERRKRQLEYFAHLPEGLDLDVLASDDMWRRSAEARERRRRREGETEGS